MYIYRYIIYIYVGLYFLTVPKSRSSRGGLIQGYDSRYISGYALHMWNVQCALDHQRTSQEVRGIGGKGRVARPNGQ